MNSGKKPYFHTDSRGTREAMNVAACALVAAKMYETYGWLRYHGGDPTDNSSTHVPGPEELAHVLTELGTKALAEKEKDHLSEQIGILRFLAYVADDGPNSYVNFYVTLGSADANEFPVRVESCSDND